MKKGIVIDSNYTFYLSCKHCSQEYDLISAKRRTPKTEPIRCPNCGCIVAK